MASQGLRILEIRENRLLARREVTAELPHAGGPTPTRQGVRELVAQALGVQPDLVYVRKILTGYGAGVSRCEVHVYGSHDAARAVEPLYVMARHGEEGKKLLEAAKKRRAERREKRRKKRKR